MKSWSVLFLCYKSTLRPESRLLMNGDYLQKHLLARKGSTDSDTEPIFRSSKVKK